MCHATIPSAPHVRLFEISEETSNGYPSYKVGIGAALSELCTDVELVMERNYEVNAVVEILKQIVLYAIRTQQHFLLCPQCGNEEHEPLALCK